MICHTENLSKTVPWGTDPRVPPLGGQDGLLCTQLGKPDYLGLDLSHLLKFFPYIFK